MNAETFSPRLLQAGSESQPQPKEAGAHARRRTLFGQPLLLEGEYGAAYNEVLARVWAAVNPADILDEMFTDEVVSLECEVLRWRRLKLCLIRARATEALEEFLRKELDYNHYAEFFAELLAKSLQKQSSGRPGKFCADTSPPMCPE
jgi:hypothetical protein